MFTLWEEFNELDSKGKVKETYMKKVKVVDSQDEANAWVNKKSDIRSWTRMVWKVLSFVLVASVLT